MNPFNLRDMWDRVAYEAIDFPLAALQNCLDSHQVDLDPDYQRGHVWTDEQAGLFVAHIFAGGDTNRLLITSEDEEHYEILDGKQRLHAIQRFLKEEIPLLLPDGRAIFLGDCTPASRDTALRRIWLPFGRITQPRADAMRLYIRLNAGGTVHSQEEIARVRALLGQEERTNI